MKFKFISFILIVFLGVGLVFGMASAAYNDVQLSTGATLALTVGGSTLEFTVTEGNVESLTVNAGSITLTLVSPGSSVVITSANKTTFSYGAGLNATFTCGASSSTLSLSGSGTETITPTGNTCSTSSGGGSGGGGGGGGGGTTSTSVSSAPAVTTTTTTAPAPAIVVVTTPTTPVTPAPTVAKPSAVAQVVSPVFNSDLEIGSRSDDVKKLQELLAQDKEIYPEGLATGYFGPATSRAVKKFQAKYGLSQVGRVGPQTRAKLNEVFGVAAAVQEVVVQPAPSAEAVSSVFITDLQRGSKGDDVSRLQKLLAQDKEMYPEGLVTGTFGPATERAVKRFQAKYGLPQVGRVGPATRAKLQDVFGGQSSSSSNSTAPAESATNEEAQKAALQSQLGDLQKQLEALLKQAQQ